MSEHKSISEALLAFQAVAPTLKKDATNPHFKSKYTPLDTIVETIQPLLTEHGLVWLTFPCWENDQPSLRYRIAHPASDSGIEGVMPLMLTKQDPQGLGSALTYARRYALTSVLNLVADDDDDGNAGSQRQQQRQAPARQNGSSEYATAEDQRTLVGAAKGLTVRQIKLALGSVGSSFPEKGELFSMVPKGKTQQLSEILAGIERDAVA